MVTLIKLSLLHYPEKDYSSAVRSDQSTAELLTEGVERTDRENRKYLTPNTFLKHDGVDSPFS